MGKDSIEFDPTVLCTFEIGSENDSVFSNIPFCNRVVTEVQYRMNYECKAKFGTKFGNKGQM